MKHSWSVAEIDRLRELAASGMPAAAIVESMGLSVYSVKTKLSHLKIRTRREDGRCAWSAEEIALAKDLAAQNRGAEEIGRRVGRSIEAVYRTLNKGGIKVRSPRHWTTEAEASLREMAATHDVEQIAAHLGRTRQAVKNKANEIGLTLGRPRVYRSISRRPPVERAAKPAPAPAPAKVVLPPVKKQPKREECSYIAYCKGCCAPVVNTIDGWAGHNERVGCNRKARRA